jgi:hypothetical protein
LDIIEKTPKNEKNLYEGATDWDVIVETGGQQQELSMTVSPTEVGEKVITLSGRKPCVKRLPDL